MNVGLLTMTEAWGGSEVHSVGLARALRERGHTATVVCLTERAYALYRERVYQQIPLASLSIPKVLERMGFVDWLRLFARQPWDVCVLIKGEFNTGGGWGIDLAARVRFGGYVALEQLNVQRMPPKTSRFHFGFIPGLGLWWYREYLRRFLRSVGPHKVVCVSHTNRQRLIEDHRFPAGKVVTVRNGIDAQRFHPDPAHAETWRRRWGIPREAIVFGAVGRLDAIKGYDTALTAFQALLKRFPEKDLRLVLVGEGPQERALKAQAEQIVPRGQVVFAPFCERPWEPLNAFDVFVMPSLNEGLPLALAEAMACGCCPVATAAGGIPEIITGPDLGWLVPVADADAFAAAMIAAACQTPEQRATMGRRTRQQVLTHFNAAIQFDALAHIIEDLAPAPPFDRGDGSQPSTIEYRSSVGHYDNDFQSRDGGI
jgi:glycosyltransferase involved in cell wall biosynthesis